MAYRLSWVEGLEYRACGYRVVWGLCRHRRAKAEFSARDHSLLEGS